MQQTPWHIIEDEAMHITFKEPSATSKIKSFISRAESASRHDVFTGVKRKSKTVLFIESLLTGEYGAHDILQSYQNTNVSFQLEHQESTTQQSPEHTKDRRAQRWQHPKTLNSAKRFRLEVQTCTAACAPHLRSRLGPLDHYSSASSRQLLVAAMHDCDSVGSLGPHCRSLRAIKGLWKILTYVALHSHGRWSLQRTPPSYSSYTTLMRRSPYADAIRSRLSDTSHFVSRRSWYMTHPSSGASNLANTSDRCLAIHQAAHATSDDRQSGRTASIH